jgi:hypothetical protein
MVAVDGALAVASPLSLKGAVISLDLDTAGFTGLQALEPLIQTMIAMHSHGNWR